MIDEHDDTEALAWLGRHESLIRSKAKRYGALADDAAQEGRWAVVQVFREGRAQEQTDSWIRGVLLSTLAGLGMNTNAPTSVEGRSAYAIESSRTYSVSHIDAMPGFDHQAPDDPATLVESELSVEDMLADLPKGQRDLARLRSVGHTTVEAAEELGIPLGRARRQWGEIRKALAERVDRPTTQEIPAGVSWTRPKPGVTSRGHWRVHPWINGRVVDGGHARSLDEAIARTDELRAAA